MKKNQIVDIDGWVHVINGKVVCFEPEAIDLTNEEELKGLLDFVSYAFTTNAFRAVHEENTMIMIDRNLLNGRMMVWHDNMECLPDDLLRKARLLVNEYRSNHIIHVIGYVHVLNGKVIVFSPETLDLTKAEDVSYLWNLSLELFVDEFYPAIYGNDTIAFVDKNSDGTSYNVSEGNLGDLPEEYQIKVREVLYEFAELESRLGLSQDDDMELPQDDVELE